MKSVVVRLILCVIMFACNAFADPCYQCSLEFCEGCSCGAECCWLESGDLTITTNDPVCPAWCQEICS